MARVSRTDVELVLTARDEVTRTVAEVSALLDRLADVADESGGAFLSMDQRAEQLRGTLEGLRDAQTDLVAKSRLVEQFKREEQELSKRNQRFREAAAEVRRLRDAQRAQAGVPAAQRVDVSADLDRAQIAAQRANRSFREMREQVRRTSEELQRNGVATNNLAESERRLVAEAQRLRSAQDQTAAALARTDAASRRAGAGMRRFGEDSRRSLSLLQRLRGEVIALAAGYVGLFGAARQVGNVFGAAQEQARIESGLRVGLGGDEAAVQGELDFLRQTSDRLAVSFLDLGRSYSQFLAAVPEGTFTLEEVQQIFVGIATAGRVLRLSNDQMERSFRAVIQIVSKGTVQMEELRGQLGDTLPGALILFAEANGIAIEELDKLVEARQVTSRSLIPFAEEIEQRLGRDLPKVMAEPVVALDILRVQWEQTLLEMGEDTDLIESLADAMRSLTAALDDPQFREGLNDIADGIAAVIRLVPALVANVDAIGKALAAFALTKVALAVARLVVLIRTLGLLGIAAKGATGPVGWIVAFGTLLYTWGDSADTVVPKISRLREELERLRALRIGEAPTRELKGQLDEVDRQLAKTEERIRTVQDLITETNDPFRLGVRRLRSELEDLFETQDLLVQQRDTLSRKLLPAQNIIPDTTRTAAGVGAKATPVDADAMEALAEAIKKANERIAELQADTLVQKLALITRKYAEQAAAARATADAADDALVAQAIAAEQRVLVLETEKKLTQELEQLQQEVDRQAAGDGLAGRLAAVRSQYQQLIDNLTELGRSDLAARASGLVEERIGGEIAAVKEQLRQEFLQLRAEEDSSLDARLELVRQKYQETISALNGVDQAGADLAEQLMNRRLDATRKAFAAERLQEAQAEIDKALELRNAVIQRIEAQRELGNLTASEAGDQLRAELADLDPRLDGLIEKARELVATLRGEGLISAEDAQIALENLRAIENGLDSLNTRAQEFAGQIREAIAGGMTDAITDFVTGVSSAGDAIRNFFADFLRMIAQAIIQQQIFNALQGGGGGGVIQSFANWAFGTNHSGGMAGTGPKRQVSPLALLGGIPEFHRGGLVGNDEVLSLLRTNEEVLTRGDPRHVLNGGGRGGQRTHVYNFFDRDEFLRAVADTPAGDEFVVNTINRNKSRIR